MKQSSLHKNSFRAHEPLSSATQKKRNRKEKKTKSSKEAGLERVTKHKQGARARLFESQLARTLG